MAEMSAHLQQVCHSHISVLLPLWVFLLFSATWFGRATSHHFSPLQLYIGQLLWLVGGEPQVLKAAKTVKCCLHMHAMEPF